MLDSYTRRARIAPASLVALPAVGVLIAGLISPSTLAKISAIAVGGVGLVIAGLVRDRGRAIQDALWRSWGGSPTVQRLRWRDADDPETVRRLHEDVSLVIERPLPDTEDETRDPTVADSAYENAVGVLRERTRDRARFPLVFEENADYGFRRNALGVRWAGVGVAAVGLAIGLAVGIRAEHQADVLRWATLALLSSACLGFWAIVVTPHWVRRAAERYADRLLGAAHLLRRED